MARARGLFCRKGRRISNVSACVKRLGGTSVASPRMAAEVKGYSPQAQYRFSRADPDRAYRTPVRARYWGHTSTAEDQRWPRAAASAEAGARAPGASEGRTRAPSALRNSCVAQPRTISRRDSAEPDLQPEHRYVGP